MTAQGASDSRSQGQRDDGLVTGLGAGVAGGRQGREGGSASEQDDFGQAQGLVLNGNVSQETPPGSGRHS